MEFKLSISQSVCLYLFRCLELSFSLSLSLSLSLSISLSLYLSIYLSIYLSLPRSIFYVPRPKIYDQKFEEVRTHNDFPKEKIWRKWSYFLFEWIRMFWEMPGGIRLKRWLIWQMNKMKIR